MFVGVSGLAVLFSPSTAALLFLSFLPSARPHPALSAHTEQMCALLARGGQHEGIRSLPCGERWGARCVGVQTPAPLCVSDG